MRALAVVLVLAGVAQAAATGGVAGRVAAKDGKARAGVVVFLEGVIDPAPEAHKPPVLKIRQRDIAFDPRMAAVVVGTTVEFPNEDKIFHNVFSISEAAKFDLGLYKSGTSKSVVFRRAGVVDVYCNIHPEMVSKIKVLENRFYALTQKDGSFRIDGVPPGSYVLKAWQPWGDEYRADVTIAAGGAASVKIELAEGRVVRSHLRKDGTPYGRYH